MELKIEHKVINNSENNLADRAAGIIRDMFLDGELKPGQRLIESDIAHLLGLSRGPIRDAFKTLEKEGIVRILPRRGTFIAELSLEDLYEIYSLRAVVEGLAARILAEKRNADAISSLQEITENMEAAKENFLQFAKLDIKFHETLCLLSNHQWLYKQWSSLKTYIWLFIRASQLLDAPGNEQVIVLHHDIVDAIRAGLPKAAELVTRRHSEIVGEEIRLAWQKEGWVGTALFPSDIE